MATQRPPVPADRPVRIAFVSTAHIHSRDFLKTVSGRNDATLAGVWDDVPDRGRRYAGEFDTRFVEDLDALVKDDNVDAFVICAENTRHLRLLEQVLPAGKPTLCEKPLTTVADEARQVADLAREHGATLTSGYFQPFFAENRAAAEAIAGGRLGKVTHLFVRKAHHAAYGRWFDSEDLRWFTNPQLAGGGALLDLGTHMVHLLLHLVGQDRPRRVRGAAANVAGVYPDVDDWGTAEIEFDSGRHGRAEAAWVGTAPGEDLQIWGSEAGLVIRKIEDRQRAVLTRPGKPEEPLPQAEARPDRMARLIAIARGQIDADELETDLRNCVNAVAVMEAAYTSAREKNGAWIELA